MQRSRLPRLLVMMPALNEEASIGAVLDRVPRQIDGVSSVEILVIDDGSTDRTVEIARSHGASVLSHGRNLGVGAALQTGLAEAIRRGVSIAVNIDSDGQFSPEDIAKLAEPVIRGRADFVTASRFKDPTLVPEMPRLKLWGNWGMSRIVSSLVRQNFADVSCGFRAYGREALLHLVLLGQFTYTQESFLVLSRHGLRMTEMPMKVRGVREHGTSRIASNLWRYAWRTVGIMYSFLRDYYPSILFNNAAALFLILSLGFAGFVSAFLFGLSAMLVALGQVAEMVARLRSVQERQLYLVRRYLPRLGEGEMEESDIVLPPFRSEQATTIELERRDANRR
jgi:glycosyltransferase involved in cell wall biosynthesis